MKDNKEKINKDLNKIPSVNFGDPKLDGDSIAALKILSWRVFIFGMLLFAMLSTIVR